MLLIRHLSFIMFAPLAACMLTPVNDTRLNTTSSSVLVSGYTPSRNATILVEVSTSPSGPWTEIGTVPGRAEPIQLRAGTVYRFSGRLAIDARFWTTLGCDQITYLRTRLAGLGGPLTSFDSVAPTGSPPLVCLAEEQNRTGNFPSAINTCRSPDSPVVRLTAPGPGARVRGNITVRTPADAAAYQCLEDLQGTLIVRNDPAADLRFRLDDISFPRLRHARALDIEYQQTFVNVRDARLVNLPLLERVRGDITLINRRPESRSDLARIDMGMPSLTRVDGDISISSDVTGSTWAGMPALTRLRGSLTMDLGGDWAISGFARLNRVDGDVNMTLSSNGFGLPALRSIGGDLVQVDGNHNNTTSFAQLQRVEGDVRLTRASSSSRIYPALTQVDGAMILDNSAGRDDLQIGGATLTINRGLTVRNSSRATRVGLPNVRIGGTAPIEFRDNAAMCTTNINAWIGGLTGWTGMATVVGNANC